MNGARQQQKRTEKKAREEFLVKTVCDIFKENERVYGCLKMQAA
jgi:hypothetical protein